MRARDRDDGPSCASAAPKTFPWRPSKLHACANRGDLGVARQRRRRLRTNTSAPSKFPSANDGKLWTISSGVACSLWSCWLAFTLTSSVRFERAGYRVLRLPAQLVLSNIAEALSIIRATL